MMGVEFLFIVDVTLCFPNSLEQAHFHSRRDVSEMVMDKSEALQFVYTLPSVNTWTNAIPERPLH